MLTYYRRIYREYQRILRRLLRASDPETIHELRVVIKKLRALYKLISEVKPDFDFDRHFGQIKSVFKASGRIRDIDITIDCLGEKQLLGNRESASLVMILHRYRIAQLSYTRKIIRENDSETDIVHVETEKILNSGIGSNKVEQFLWQRLSKIRKIRHKHISKTRLHKIRKLYKEYLYISNATGRSDVLIGQDLSQIDDLQKRIGRWHDYLISSSVVEVMRPAAQGRLEILKSLKKKEKEMRRSIIKSL